MDWIRVHMNRSIIGIISDLVAHNKHIGPNQMCTQAIIYIWSFYPSIQPGVHSSRQRFIETFDRLSPIFNPDNGRSNPVQVFRFIFIFYMNIEVMVIGESVLLDIKLDNYNALKYF